MADLLGLSSRIIDEGVAQEPVNRITQELSELGEDLAVVESFSHVISIRTEDGLVLFDTSGVPRVDLYQRRRKREASLMAKGIFGHAARESAKIAFDDE